MRQTNRPIHIVHVQESLEVGGLENGVVNIANGLDPDRFRTTICCLMRLGALTLRINNSRVDYLCLDEKEGKRPGLFLKLRNLFSALHADIVHTHNFYSGLYGIIGARLAIGTRIIHGEHGNHAFSGAIRRAAVRYVYPMADRILTVSDHLRLTMVRSGIPVEKVTSILNGVDTERFKPSEAGVAKRLSLGIGEPCIVFGYVGRISPEKGVDRLLRAFSLVRQRHPNTRLMIVGDGLMLEAMRGLSETLGIREAVYFLGSRHDVHELYWIFDIFVLPSLVEGLSNVILEAMASGLAIVATKVGGNCELIVDGQNGLLVPPDSVEALSRDMAMLVVNHEYRQRLAIGALTSARADLSIERMIRNYEDLYTNVYLARKEAERVWHSWHR